MSLHISIDCFGSSIDFFGLSRIKKWMSLIITVNLSTGIISINSFCFLLSAYLRNAKPMTVSSDQPAQKKCKTNSASNSRVLPPLWLKQFNWLGYDAETKLCSAEHECINLGQ